MQCEVHVPRLLADAAELVSLWRAGAVCCFDGDKALVADLGKRRELLFGQLREALGRSGGLCERCELISAMFAVALDASSVPDPRKEEICRALAERTLQSPDCAPYLEKALRLEADGRKGQDDRTIAAVRRLAEDLAWPEEPE